LPHISNFTDFDALGQEEDVALKYIKNVNELDGADVVIIPGSKSTISDLIYLKKSRLAEKIKSIMASGNRTILIGICGGYQMLGENIIDLERTESRITNVQVMGLLPIKTIFKSSKMLSQVEAMELSSNFKIKGYEIHHGQSYNLNNAKAVFKITKANGKKVNRLDGLISENGYVWGTYIHGIFDNDIFRRDFLNRIRIKKGLAPIKTYCEFNIDREFDKLAELFRKNLDMKFLYNILGLKN
jgi:adenosylcobyric acid synthase